MNINLEIINGKLLIYEVDSSYRKKLENFESKVSQKDNRKFYGILLKCGIHNYCIPFTSKIKHRNSKLTINIKQKDIIIAQLLLNNMIPVRKKDLKLIDINAEKYSDYLKNEIIYLNKPQISKEIVKKSKNIFEVINDENNKDFLFFKKICCDFNLLETVYKKM